jgi:hypothetical protein
MTGLKYLHVRKDGNNKHNEASSQVMNAKERMKGAEHEATSDKNGSWRLPGRILMGDRKSITRYICFVK